MNFNNVVKLAFAGNAVFLRQIKPFGWLAKPLRIPLADLDGEMGNGWVRERFEASVASVPDVRLRVYGAPRHLLAERVAAEG